ncbi:MAG: DNA-binding protein [Anaerocolumna sp.]|jgi:AraC family transcriptional regulator of arabinose operon|nr:DNA-binding protein [Anaerocolumna sp.]
MIIQVNDIGYEIYHSLGLDIYRPEGTNDYLFLYFRTAVEVLIDGTYIELEPGTFYLFPKETPQFYRKLNAPLSNDWVHFNTTLGNNFFHNLQIPFCTPLKLDDDLTINRMMYDLRNEFFHVGHHHEEIMDVKMQALFLKFSDLYHGSSVDSEKPTPHYKKLLLLRYQIDTNEYLRCNIEEIAAGLNLSASYLSHLYKDTFGISIGQDLIKSRVNYAKSLLIYSKYTIGEISFICGYENIEHFSRQFKKLTSFSPRSYKDQLNKWS